MRGIFVAGILALLGVPCLAQMPLQGPQAPASEQAPSQASPIGSTITIPAGTRVPVTLASPIITKKDRKGDAVRVATAFPVTVGTRLAIPAGTYVEGTIDKIEKHRGGDVHLQMSFTRMIYASGYEVSLIGATVLSKAEEPGRQDPRQDTGGSFVGLGNGFLPQQEPPPLPQVGPNKAVVIGATVGVVAAVAVIGIIVAHHRGGGNEPVIDEGTQFDLVFQEPVTVDAARIAPASATR
jgi:hypothetical protein